MDTAWFAVDEDGHVGRFETGEDGAVPNAAANEEGIDSFMLRAVLAARRLAQGENPPALATQPRHPARIVFAIDAAHDAPATYRSAIESTAARLVPGARIVREAAPRVCASDAPVTPEVIAKLSAHPDVRCVLLDSELWEWLDEGDAGIFTYRNEWGDGPNPGAYKRANLPTEPIVASDLPGDLRAELAALELPVRFDQTEALHLADHMTDDDAVCYGEITLRGEVKAAAPPVAVPKRRSKSPTRTIVAILVALVLVALWAASRR